MNRAGNYYCCKQLLLNVINSVAIEHRTIQPSGTLMQYLRPFSRYPSRIFHYSVERQRAKNCLIAMPSRCSDHKTADNRDSMAFDIRLDFTIKHQFKQLFGCWLLVLLSIYQETLYIFAYEFTMITACSPSSEPGLIIDIHGQRNKTEALFGLRFSASFERHYLLLNRLILALAAHEQNCCNDKYRQDRSHDARNGCGA